jgi:hypothetical protein
MGESNASLVTAFWVSSESKFQSVSTLKNWFRQSAIWEIFMLVSNGFGSLAKGQLTKLFSVPWVSAAERALSSGRDASSTFETLAP